MALQPAIAGIGRAGNTRSGFGSRTQLARSNAAVTFKINGTDCTRLVSKFESEIIDQLNDAPNSATIVVRGVTPAVGQTVSITRNLDNAFLFGGLVQTITPLRRRTGTRVRYRLECVDWTFQLDRRLVNKTYATQSASTTAAAIMADYTSGFTTGNLERGLNSVGLPNKMETVSRALTRLANLAGAFWYIDDDKDLHFRTTENLPVPATLDTTNATFKKLSYTKDIAQVRTRCYVEGLGTTLTAAVAVGATAIPVDTIAIFSESGGLANAEGQMLTYTGVQAGGAGTLVGTGASPAAAPAAALASGGSVEAGAHDYAYTLVTAAGESLPSPLLTVTVGTLAAPTSTPSGTANAGAGVDVGTHEYEVTFVTATGETTPGPISGSVTTGSTSIANPTNAITKTGDISGSMAVGAYTYAYTFTNAVGETAPSPSVTANCLSGGATGGIEVSFPTGPSGTTGRKIYRTTVGPGAQLKLVTTIANNSTTLYDDGNADASLGANAPVSNTTTASTCQIALTSIPIGVATVTSRKIYRRFNGAGSFYLVTTIANNSTTTYTDTTANASLGAVAPVTNTATVNTVSLSSISVGSATVTSRKVYRTAAAASQLKLLTTIANNTATTFSDTTADASLGANVPTSDTSGLTQPSGQVNAGATTLVVAGSGAFTAGWALIAGGQLIRYTGVSGNTLTGIPASGSGAITATVVYNSTITVASVLTGVPASGTGSVVTALNQGDEVNLIAQVDDTAAQASLAALEGGDGIREHYIQDRRLSIAGATARGTAELTLGKDPDETVTFTSEDWKCQSGRSVTVNIADISVTVKIQHVRIYWKAGRWLPQRDAIATNRFKDFYQYVRDLEDQASRA